jgi:dTDP-4-amino-4,6-dideoxygalactose transaminase
MTNFNSSPFTDTICEFENQVATFFNAPYAVATDSCTHALELCLRYEKYNYITIPKRTYISIPFLAIKLGLTWEWKEEKWKNYYYIGNTNIIDAAVLWEKNSYIPGTYMCLSFQFRKHLNLGRGGIILLDNKDVKDELKKMSYDGRDPNYPWYEQNINTVGYHYYMTPETAKEGIKKLSAIQNLPNKIWTYEDYPYLPNMSVFKT